MSTYKENISQVCNKLKKIRGENLKSTDIPFIDLKDIVFKKLKLNKACDIYKLTVEHLRNSGDETLSLVLYLLNLIIDNINQLSSTQLNTAAASIVYKGKRKPIYHHKSYRQVRVTPLIGRCLDEHIRPYLVTITKPIQNSSQYRFTEGITYMMGGMKRRSSVLTTRKLSLAVAWMGIRLLRWLIEPYTPENCTVLEKEASTGWQVTTNMKIPKL
jgi:hypothetical protein